MILNYGKYYIDALEEQPPTLGTNEETDNSARRWITRTADEEDTNSKTYFLLKIL